MSKQIYGEASKILHGANAWLKIEVNRPCWIEGLQECGFDVIGLRDGTLRPRLSFLSLQIHYDTERGNDEDAKGTECFLISIWNSGQLPRT